MTILGPKPEDDPAAALALPQHVLNERARQREADRVAAVQKAEEDRLAAIEVTPDNLFTIGVSFMPMTYLVPGTDGSEGIEGLVRPALCVEWTPAEGYATPDPCILVMLPGAFEQFLVMVANATHAAVSAAVTANRERRLARRRQQNAEEQRQLEDLSWQQMEEAATSDLPESGGP